MKGKNNYIFPNVLANFMSKLDLKVQLESSMMSMSLMLVGMVLTTFYLGFYYHPPLWYKIVLIINLIAAMVFMSSFIITTFQQFKSYMEAIEFQKELKLKGGSNKNAKENNRGITTNA